MKSQLENFKTMLEYEKSLSPSEREIKNFLYKQEPKIRRIHNKMIAMLDKHYKENEKIPETSYLALLLLECTYIQTMLSKLYGVNTPAEDLIEELKNADIQS